MNIKEFTDKVKNQLSLRLGEDYLVTAKEVIKNNSVIMQGLLIQKGKQNIAPTIYMEAFFECYEHGMEWDRVINRILETYRAGVPGTYIDMEFFKVFDRVRDRIVFKLIHAEKNKELLTQIPHIEFLDLAICFCYFLDQERLGNGTVLIHNNHVQMWKTNTKELLRLAQMNTPRLYSAELIPLGQFLMETCSDEMLQQEPELDLDPETQLNIPLRILSNKMHVYGAAAMLYPDILSKFAEEKNADLYILPSSVHEVLILEDSGNINSESLQKMVEEVNASQVLPEEYLSDHVYFYDRKSRQIKIIA